MNDHPRNPSKSLFAAAVAEHDRAVKARGTVIWVGAEPTFTDRFSEQPAWLHHALGADKEARAQSLLAGLYQPGMAVLRTAGRQYPGESQPRWSVGLYGRRDGRPVWVGPPDPLLTRDLAPPGPAAVHDFGRRLNHSLRNLEHDLSFLVGGKTGLRMVYRRDDRSPWVDSEPGPEPGPESVHDRVIPPGGRCEEPTADADLLLAIGLRQLEAGGPLLVVVELPAIGNVSAFLALLDVIGRAARAAHLPGLVFQGSPPPVGPSVAWTTLTPDPAVVEVNGAPTQDASHFYDWVQRVYAVAERVRLWPYRLQYNGIVSDSGGGGHLTLGGPTPRESPFFLTPTLLPRLLRYLNRHPSLSYWFATTSIGISGQSPRPDEGPGQMFAELEVALDLLDRLPDGDAETIARSLAPFLVDASGNPHRAELNLEKLWNPRLPVRGCLGLVEFRAFGMARSPEAAAARACLLRAVTAMLIEEDKVPRLHHWGDTLHDRFALPFYLQQDLREVLADLHSAGLALGEPIAEHLLHNPDRLLGAVELDGCRLEFERALEFWPLVGDIASQEAGGSRLVDSSTTRLQVTLRPLPGAGAELGRWRLSAGPYRVPLRSERDERGPLRLFGLRYRNFLPGIGLHPLAPPRDRLELIVSHPGVGRHWRVTIHEWRPDGEAYPGLPLSLEDAQARRRARMVVEVVEATDPDTALDPPSSAVTPCCLDLRRL